MENSNATQGAGLQFFNATGVRQAKSTNDSVIIAESTRASFKIMPAVAAVLGIKDGDFVTTQLTKDEHGVVNGVYFGKGKNAEYQKDANGNYILDDRKRKVAVEGKEGFGALASEQTPGTNVLKISVASAWDAIGSTDLKKHYKLSDAPVSVSLPIGDGEFLTTDLYKLEFVKDEAKVERKPKAKTDAVAQDVAAQDAGNAGSPVMESPAVEQPVQATPEQAFEAPDADDDEF